MKVIIAMDSFKGSLSSLEAGKAISEGIKCVISDAQTSVFPIADGGEGTVDAMVVGMNGEYREVSVLNPLGKPIMAKYGVVGKTAIIEIAQAAGITLISENERNPLNTTTFGVGEIIKDAVKNGYRDFIIGLGGSATNDGGFGMLSALGFDFLDKNGNHIELGAKGLENLHSISTENVMPELNNCNFNLACDVTNPLCGDNGCSAIFAPQKGADEKMIKSMDKWLANYAEISKRTFPLSNQNLPGSGAAGGLGFAFTTFLRGTLMSGVQLIIEKTQIEKCIIDADIVITGEGRLDSQTVMGKTPIGIAELAKKYNKTVIAFAGCVTDDANLCNLHGIDAYFSIIPSVCSLDCAMKNAYNNLKNTVIQVFRLLNWTIPHFV